MKQTNNGDNMPASLYGIIHSNRDFSNENCWGKNMFNTSFPAALAIYMHSKDMDFNYISMAENRIHVGAISAEDTFNISPGNNNIYYSFESSFGPYNRYVQGNLPRIDLVIMDRHSNDYRRCLEIKLTTIPDSTTCGATDESLYGSEIVIRPDSLVYVACSIFHHNKEIVHSFIDGMDLPVDWYEQSEYGSGNALFGNALQDISRQLTEQVPLIMHPIWKTVGRSPVLSDDCLDMFIWSDASVCNLIAQRRRFRGEGGTDTPSRIERSKYWLFKMLYDMHVTGTFNHTQIMADGRGNQTDKAFAYGGSVTRNYMGCDNLTHPRIGKNEIRNIILGGGQNYLKPERRFDAIIVNSPELFR